MRASAQATTLLRTLGVRTATRGLAVRSPVDGSILAHVPRTTPAALDVALARAEAAFRVWRDVPAPKRGELVRRLGEELRAHKEPLARLVTLECGKILEEARGEVQEMIDVCDFAVGLSRQLYGLTIASERPGHRMMEQWHPFGVVGVVSAFNFPVAVWAWNAALALVCGDPVVWKPSEKTPLTALASQALLARALRGMDGAPDGLAQVVVGGAELAEQLADDPRVALLSATGSTRMGRALAPRVAARFGRSLLELGGNNAMIVTPSADLEMAVRAITFSAVGTAGQRCTTLRRLIVHRSVEKKLVARLREVFDAVKVGDPREPGTLVGPLVDEAAHDAMRAALARAQAEGGEVLAGGRRVRGKKLGDGVYVRPALVRMPRTTRVVREETFAPILYVVPYTSFEQALREQNGVAQGLSSSIFTTDVREAEAFVAASGSDCGIANVNLGPSGAEIGGAFGGEKETGGGRESGSDAWKAYMRRQTSTTNYSRELPLAQGIRFDVSVRGRRAGR